MLTRYTGPVHFEDLSGKQFERLAFSYFLHTRRWTQLSWLGESGQDGGRDIWGERKIVGADSTQTTCIQCANFRSLNLRKIVTDLEKLLDLDVLPDEVLVICGGSVSAYARNCGREKAASIGINQFQILSGAEFEEYLRRDAPGLLFRFFGGEPFPDGLELVGTVSPSDDQVEEAIDHTRAGIPPRSSARKILFLPTLLVLALTGASIVVKQQSRVDTPDDIEKLTPTLELIRGVGTNDPELVASVLGRGADPNIELEDGDSLFSKAVMNGYKEIVDLFLKHGVELRFHVESESLGGSNRFFGVWHEGSELDTAKAMGFSEIEQSLENFATNAARETENLMQSVIEGSIDGVTKALGRGADPNFVFPKEDTPILLIAMGEPYNPQVIQALLAKGASMYLENGHGETPFDYAWHDPEMMRIFLDHDAFAGSRSDVSETLLFDAARAGNLRAVKFFLDYGEDATVMNDNGKTASDIADEEGHFEIARLLKAAQEGA